MKYLNAKIKRCYPTGCKAGTWTCILDVERTKDGKTGELRELHLKLTPSVSEYKAETYYKKGTSQVSIEDVPFQVTEKIKQFFTDVVINDTEYWQTNAVGHTRYFHPAFGNVAIYDRVKLGNSSNIVFY